MAIIKISVANPNDGTSTFTSVRFYEATDSSGTGATLLATVAIDTTSRYKFFPGVTSYTYTSGATTKYYAAKYYSTVTTNASDYTTWTLGGEDRWDTMFKNELIAIGAFTGNKYFDGDQDWALVDHVTLRVPEIIEEIKDAFFRLSLIELALEHPEDVTQDL